MSALMDLVPSHLAKVRAGRRGSGWAVGRQGVLTARHVVAPFLDRTVNYCLAVLDPSPQGQGFDCTVVYDDAQRDLALLPDR